MGQRPALRRSVAARDHAGDPEEVGVHLGPSFYVDHQALKLAKGDRIEVTGSRRTLAGGTVIVAQEVRRGDQVLTLRDASGLPRWRGQGPGR